MASVLGETFTFDLLSAVFPIDIEEETLRMHLADLMARNFFQVQLKLLELIMVYCKQLHFSSNRNSSIAFLERL